MRRLLLPLWAYGIVVLAATAVRAMLNHQSLHLTASGLAKAGTWVLPLTDPAGSAWHGGWLSDHLWYLRAYLWIVLLAPVFVWLARRVRYSVPALGLAIVVLDISTHRAVPLLASGRVRVIVGDLVTYGLFAMLGIAFHERHHIAPPRKVLLAGAAASALGVVVYMATVGLPGGDVNQSYPAVALTGLTWILLAGAAEGWIRRVAAAPRVRARMLAFNGRAETVYIWHPAAIVVAYAIVDHWAPVSATHLVDRFEPVAIISLVAMVALGTALAVRAFGWVEDLGAGRRRLGAGWQPHLPVRWSAAVVPASAIALAVAAPLIVLPISAEGAQAAASKVGFVTKPPSYRPALTNSDFTRTAVAAAAVAATTTTTAPRSTSTTARARAAAGAAAPARDQTKVLRLVDEPLDAASLQTALDAWAAHQPGLTGISVGVAFDGKYWTGVARGPGVKTSSVHLGDQYAVASLTKTFTIALVLQQVSAGHINLDAPMPDLAGVDDPPDGVVITPRELLQHTSGLVDYSAADGFDEHAVITPAQAVDMALHTTLLSDPGKGVHYSSTNYLWLGLLLEKVTGRSYTDLVAGLASTYGLPKTRVDGTAFPGRVGFSAAGVHSTIADMAKWGDLLFTPGRVVGSQFADALTHIDDNNMGLGTWPLCPCTMDAEGTKYTTAMGQYVADGGLYTFPDRMTIVVHVDPPAANSEARIIALQQALAKVVPGA
jgi:CubicO group peptidase (beta-lactamase class C family)